MSLHSSRKVNLDTGEREGSGRSRQSNLPEGRRRALGVKRPYPVCSLGFLLTTKDENAQLLAPTAMLATCCHTPLAQWDPLISPGTISLNMSPSLVVVLYLSTHALKGETQVS